MKRFFLILTAALLTIVLGVIAWDALRSGSYAKRASSLKIGDSKKQVEQVLGKPTEVFTPESGDFLLSVRTETWAYGSHFRFQEAFLTDSPDFSPILIRFWRPDEKDVVIEFGSNGIVSAINVPQAIR